MKAFFTLIALSFSLPIWSMVVIKTADCPTQFEGRVKVIVEAVGPSDVFSKDKVIFENLRTLKGNAKEQLSVEILHNGPFKVEYGKEYRVQLRHEKLCWIEEI